MRLVCAQFAVAGLIISVGLGVLSIDAARVRGLGWDLAPPFAPNSEEGLSAGSYGHSGFTGTMIWIDPGSHSYVIVLSNRTYPDGCGDAQALRKTILAHVSASLGPLTPVLGGQRPTSEDHHGEQRLPERAVDR